MLGRCYDDADDAWTMTDWCSSRATWNETLAGGETIKAGLQSYFPALSGEDAEKILEARKSPYRQGSRTDMRSALPRGFFLV